VNAVARIRANRTHVSQRAAALLRLLLCALLLFSWVAPSSAQTEAQTRGPFTVYHVPAARRLADRLLSASEATHLPGIPDSLWRRDSIHIVLAPNERAFNELTGGHVPEWGAGVAIPAQSVIVLPGFASSGRGPAAGFSTVLQHELAHIGLYRALEGRRIPRWFNEGYASFAANQLDWSAGWKLRIAFATGRAPPLDSLELGWPSASTNAELAYLLSATTVQYLWDESGERGLELLIARWRTEGTFDRALQKTYGIDIGKFESEWHKYVKRRFGWVFVLTQSAVFFGIIGILVGVLFSARIRRDRRRLAALRAADVPYPTPFWSEGGVEIIAHRGYSARAPENTLSAMELAIELGVPALEFDVHATRDGVPVVIHDSTLNRTTNGSGRIAQLDFAQLRNVDAGSWFSPDFVGEPIPALADVLRLAQGRVNRVYVELKPGGFTAAQLERVVAELVEHGFADRAVVMSFDWTLLDHIRSFEVPLTIAFLADDEGAFLDALQRAARDRNALVDCNYRILLKNPRLVERAHSMGIELAVYTVNDSNSASRLEELGVRRITTNEVGPLLRWARGRTGETSG